jgi:GR25 family glycosyltransferase involved in LPS biosynthesis
VNVTSFSGPFDRLRFSVKLRTRFFDTTRSSTAFASGDQHDAILRIYVINLDRKPDRWRQVSRELERLSGRSGTPLSRISTRFAAVDGRYFDGVPHDEVLEPHYSLADQLLVEPIPQLSIEPETRDRRISMTPPEVAIALSHIGVWRVIAASGIPYTLVLEDDIYFRRGFAQSIDEAWAALLVRSVNSGPVDLLYLSFKEAREGPPTKPSSGPLCRPQRGLWQLSGYVLSCAGAQKLLDLLPARGPIDLWLNLQFSRLDVLTTRRAIVEQRTDVPSTNSYSVLPILSQLGVLTREKPLVVRHRALLGPVFALGESGSGLTALATALSILGYRCCSDISELPAGEHRALFEKKTDRAFNAYVNVRTLGPDALARLAKLYQQARFIITTNREIAF